MKRANKVPQRKRSFRRLIRRGRGRPVILSTAFSVVVLMFIYADSIISNLSLQSTAFGSIEISSLLPSSYDRANEPAEITRPVGKVLSLAPTTAPPVPPLNSTREDRIAWLQGKLPELEIFQAGTRAEAFHGRVTDFFGDGCGAGRFFMTWLSPVSQFGPRELLSIDSLFKAHPSGCLVLISGSMDSMDGLMTLKPMIDKGFRMLSVTPNLPFLVNNTPARAWFEEMKAGKRDPGVIPLGQNLSNLIRLAFLYKYGGVYTDTDFIFLKKFDGLRNTIGAQSMEARVSRNTTSAAFTLNNAVLVFDKEHPLVYKFLEEFASTFDGNRWGFNGPKMVTRVVNRLGGPSSRSGENFTVVPPEAFYPVDWTRIWRLFKKPRSPREARWVDAEAARMKRVAYGVHLWNKKSRGLRIEEGSVMKRLMSDHCVICSTISSSST